MKFRRLCVLLPCPSFDDLPLPREASGANQLFAAYSALWHPALLASAEVLPAWAGLDTAPDGLADHVLIIPPMTKTLISPQWVDEAIAAGACVVQDFQTRSEVLAAALRPLGPPPVPLEPALAADFLALGIGQFLVALSDRQNRYADSGDATLGIRAVEAAKAAVAGDLENARRLLQNAFDALHQSRQYYNPSDLHLLDLTLVCQTTIGAELRAELGTVPIFAAESAQFRDQIPPAGGHRAQLGLGLSPLAPEAAQAIPRNLLVSGEVIEEMARREPATLEALRTALEKNTAVLVGGELGESELPLLPPEAIALRLRRGAAAYQRHLGRAPAIFGRRRFGLTPVLPQILRKYGFVAALHFALDDGTFPASKQSRIRWEGPDGGTLEALSRIPLDAGDAAALARVPEKLDDAVNLDHVATMVFAHWPGGACPCYDDLQRIAAHCSVLGKFAAIDEYFRDTEYSGQLTRYPADRYQSPYLRQAVEKQHPDPISRWARYYSRRTAAEAGETLAAFHSLLTGTPPAALGTVPIFAAQPTLLCDQIPPAAGHRAKLGLGLSPSAQCEALLLEIEDALDNPARCQPAVDERLQDMLQAELGRVAEALAGRAAPASEGFLAINPWTFSQQVRVAGAGELPPYTVETPGLGFAWIDPGGPVPGNVAAKPEPWWRRGKPKRQPPPLAESALLRNEFFEVHFSPTSGTVQSVSDYQTRGNRLSQQIALRSSRTAPEQRDEWGQLIEDPNFAYSIPAVDEMTVTACDETLGEITSRGRLVGRDSRQVARFRQVTRIRRGSRVLELEIELDSAQPPGPDPWKSYYAVRWAWEDEAAELYRGVNTATCPTSTVQLESPHFVEVRSGDRRTTILSGGLPYHRRQGARMLDTLLVVRGETARRFRLGVGFDLSYPMAAAIDFLAPRLVVPAAVAPSRPSGWLFYLDVNNVVATHWEPVVAQGQVAGFRVRLLETEGRRAPARLRAFRPIRAAQRLENADDAPVALPTNNDAVAIEIGPYQWVEVQCLW